MEAMDKNLKVALKHRLLSIKSGVLLFLTAHNKAICQIVAQ